MKWIKAINKIPIDKTASPVRHYSGGQYLKVDGVKAFGQFISSNSSIYCDYITDSGSGCISENDFSRIEWLDESTPSHGRTAEEILAGYESFHWTNDGMDETHYYKDNVIQAMHDHTNQAMEEHRTQPQEVREEVECTHPYKECVMSDRVNKYGTPLTKCSVCGNDNICDEEIMDESVNTFTKEDLRTAFDGAEYFVDFDKWFDAFSTQIK